MADLKFEIVEKIGEINENAKGWKKEFNLVSWNDRPAKYDIREWSPDNTKMGKGLTFTKEEIIKLKILLNEIDL